MTVGGAMRGGKCLRPNDAARRVHLVATIVLYDSDTTPAREHLKAQGAERHPPRRTSTPSSSTRTPLRWQRHDHESFPTSSSGTRRWMQRR